MWRAARVSSSVPPHPCTWSRIWPCGVVCSKSAERMLFLWGVFVGFSKPSQDFLLCYAQHSCGVLIFLAKIISFRLRGLGSLLFNDVV